MASRATAPDCDPPRPVEFMYQMVAVDAPEAALCSKISPNATFAVMGGATALLQSHCYLHIAFNTRDLRLCEPLPAAGSFPHINERYDSREHCRENVAIYSRPDYKGNATYGAARFPRAADFPGILREIGYDARTQPRVPEPTADDYWEFVSRLNHRGTAGDARRISPPGPSARVAALSPRGFRRRVQAGLQLARCHFRDTPVPITLSPILILSPPSSQTSVIRRPASAGVKVTVIVQDAPIASSEDVHVLLAAKCSS